MFFKKKAKQITWKANVEGFSVYANQKEMPADIPNIWVGNDLLIFLEKLNKYYMLEDYDNNEDGQLREAIYVADGDSILWSKSGDGYYLYDNGLAVNDESESTLKMNVMFVTYKEQTFLLKDYDQIADDILQEAILVNYANKIHWFKAGESFYMLYKGRFLDLNHTAHYSRDDLTIFVDDFDALLVMYGYNKHEQFSFQEAFKIADKGDSIWRRTDDGSFNLFFNHHALHSNSIATYHNDDVVVYSPEMKITYLLCNMRNADKEEFHKAEIISSSGAIFWSSNNNDFYLIDKGKNISGNIGRHNSVIGTDLLAYNPETTTTYFFQNFKNLQDNQLRPALILSRSAKVVWKGYDNSYNIWYEGKPTGECEHQYLGNDLMVMPKASKIMMNLKNFKNCQDNRLRVIEE